MEITFTTGLSDVAAQLVRKKEKEKVRRRPLANHKQALLLTRHLGCSFWARTQKQEAQSQTVWEQYMAKRREKRKERRTLRKGM